MEIIYSDQDIIVINKPPGISVHGGDSVSGPTVADFLLAKFPEIAGVGDNPVRPAHPGEARQRRPGIVHRLDKDTSGVMVVARNQESFFALKKLFQTRTITKIYRAIVCGAPNPAFGVINFPIGRLVKNPTKRGIDDGRGGVSASRPAITEYRVITAGEKYSLVELCPKTGRMHQLRVHMAAVRHPIACDKKYGGRNVCCPAVPGESGAANAQSAGALPPRHLLHAQSLSFSLVPGRVQSFEADPPADFILARDAVV